MSFANPSYLVAPDWLEANLDDPSVVVLDVTAKLSSSLENDAGAALWADAHIPGSHFFDVPAAKGVLSDPDADLPWTWPSADRFEATMATFGIGADSRVILTARTPRAGIDSGTMWCTRAWWTMHHFGVDCAILQGGIERWQAEGRALTADQTPAPTPPAAPFVTADGWERARATSADVLAALEASAAGTRRACVVDALPEASFDGSPDAPVYGPRRGHITGAVNVPFRRMVDAETCGFVDADRMRAVLAEDGLLDAPEVITYCGGAIAATVDAFCLALLGNDNVSVYDGSLMEWAADADLPMTDPSG